MSRRNGIADDEFGMFPGGLTDDLPAAAAGSQPCSKPGLRPEDWLIYDLVIQSIRPNKDGEYFSEFIGAFARSLRHCCKVGLMTPAAGYENDVTEEDRVFAARSLSKYGGAPSHDPDTCWHCMDERKRKSSGVQ